MIRTPISGCVWRSIVLAPPLSTPEQIASLIVASVVDGRRERVRPVQTGWLATLEIRGSNAGHLIKRGDKVGEFICRPLPPPDPDNFPQADPADPGPLSRAEIRALVTDVEPGRVEGLVLTDQGGPARFIDVRIEERVCTEENGRYKVERLLHDMNASVDLY